MIPAPPRTGRRQRIPFPGSSPATAARGRRLGGRLARSATALLHQTLWCLGRDIQHPDGNLLLAHGFTRLRPPADVPGSSRYQLASPEAAVAVWGFGVWFAAPGAGSVFLRRYAFRPKWHPGEAPPAAFTPIPLGQWTAPRTPAARAAVLRLTAQAAAWFAAYETWVDAVAGPEWRVGVLQAWDAPGARPGDTTRAWRALAALLEREAARTDGTPAPPA